MQRTSQPYANWEYRKYKATFPVAPLPAPSGFPRATGRLPKLGRLAVRPAGSTQAAGRLTRRSCLGLGDRPQPSARRSETLPRWARGSEKQARVRTVQGRCPGCQKVFGIGLQQPDGLRAMLTFAERQILVKYSTGNKDIYQVVNSQDVRSWSMSNRQELLESIAAMITDYRADDLASPAPTHVETWINQFDTDVQLPILHEMNHVLKKTYIPLKKYRQFSKSRAKVRETRRAQIHARFGGLCTF